MLTGFEILVRAYRARAKALRQQQDGDNSLTEDRQLFIARLAAEYEAIADELEAIGEGK